MDERREGRGEKKPINPAKQYLMQYRGLLIRYQELIEQIAEAEERATDISARLSLTKVQAGRAQDVVGDGAARAADAAGLLIETADRIRRQLRDILDAIDSVPDEMGKAILTKRYIGGKSWKVICADIGYEKTRINELHGWALLAVNRWMAARK